MDDEYFVPTIVRRKDVGDNPSAASAIDSIHGSFTKPQESGFTRALLDSITEIPVHSPAGLYLRNATSYDVDLRRLCNVIERITRGLYFHEFKIPLPDDQQCATYALDGFRSAGSEVNATIGRVLVHALSGRMRTFGDKVFRYWVQRVDGPTSITLWAFLVYGYVEFMAITMPRNKIQRCGDLPTKLMQNHSSSESEGGTGVVPTGLLPLFPAYPGLTSWAKLFRRFAAGFRPILVHRSPKPSGRWVMCTAKMSP
jgi:hypothetical protein